MIREWNDPAIAGGGCLVVIMRLGYSSKRDAAIRDPLRPSAKYDNEAMTYVVKDLKFDIGCVTPCFANICENFCPCILVLTV